ncbi:CPBP family intramembrane glutamic endopeptidase [Streptomyces sp. G-G2]|uniref:CPBP family intramembrane glutamic endopeptidase n=1 Tax=Streptomyces sp. G-G2 TaxID=3046201 RepID=UPI0024BB4591|nr:CPBP family intramembrane glutamic endopeptidase [Streptomyces sp. G-G2]MDJ0384896.1 CPBP family intramembrane metalloprotease [Streptomyces sp. G-G2]
MSAPLPDGRPWPPPAPPARHPEHPAHPAYPAPAMLPTGPLTAPAGSPYAAQARNGTQRPLRELGATALLLVMGLVAMIGLLAAAALSANAFGIAGTDPAGEKIFSDPLADEALGLISLGLAIPAVLLVVRRIQRRPAGTISSVTGRLRLGWLGLCSVLALPALATQIGLLVWLLPPDGPEGAGDLFSPPAWPTLLLSLAVVWALVPFQAAAEEYLFRGWILQAFGAHLRRPWAGIAVGSLLFALAHGFGQWSGFALLCYSAAWYAWLTLRTGGLEAAIAHHMVNNLLAFTLEALADDIGSDGTAADAPWQALALDLVLTPLYCLCVVRLSERRSVRTLSS